MIHLCIYHYTPWSQQYALAAAPPYSVDFSCKIQHASVIIFICNHQVGRPAGFESIKSTCLSWRHLCYICFPTFSSKPVPGKIALSVCSPALKIKCSAPRRSAVNLLQMLVKTSEETFSLVMCQKKKEKSVRGAAEYFNNSATRGGISTWIYMQGPNVICH